MFRELPWHRAAGMGGPSGLRYELLPLIAPLHQITPDANLIRGLRVMESATLEALRDDGK